MSITLAKDVALAISLTLLTSCAGPAATRAAPRSTAPTTRAADDKPCDSAKADAHKKAKKVDPASEFLDLDACPTSQPAGGHGKARRPGR
jgi:hypothetical protein